MKQSGTKRQSPSVERQLALALVAVIERVDLVNEAAGADDFTQLHRSAGEARTVLSANGYENLESIPTRVKRIETEIGAALKAQDGAKLARLGAALDRAKKGLPPLVSEKKTPQSPKPRKARKKKDTETGDLVLRDDAKLESLTEGSDDEAEWLTRHPEPREN